METIANILMGAGSIAAGVYCFVLSRRLKAFNQLERGMGGAIAVLSAQVDDMTHALKTARSAASSSSKSLQEMTERAEDAAKRLELMLASLHDLPNPADNGAKSIRVVRRRNRADGLEAAE
jgi:hypothetical protein